MKRTVATLLLIACANFCYAKDGINKPEQYSKNSSLQLQWAKESLEHFPIDKNDKILDVGCGDGKVTEILAKSAPKGIVVGLDISEKMVEFAVKNHSTSNTIFLVGDAGKHNHNEQFDKVVSFSALHWVEDQKGALKSMKKSLKEKGLLLIVLPEKSGLNIGTIVDEMIADEKWRALFPDYKPQRFYFSAEEYKSFLDDLKIKIISLTTTEHIAWFADKDALIKYHRPLLNFIEHLTAKQQDEFVNELVDRKIASSDLRNAEGAIGIRHVKLEVIGRKN